MEFKKKVLDNGLTIIGEVNEASLSAAVGFFCKTGSRDETDEISGVSHFLEHMMFKGTEKMSALEVNEAFDHLGAKFNAFTSEENTVYYAAVLPEYLPDATYTLDGDDLQLANSPNVFSRDHLDLGTRFLLPQLPRTDEPLEVVDVGSGNGVLGLVLARQCAKARVLGLDESYQAVSCARRNARTAGLDETRIRFQVEGGLQGLPAGSFDLVVCNPPFHQAQAVGDQIAWGMFHQSRRILKPEGRLLIVSNRHLGYHIKLKRLFGNCTVVASHRKFVVLQATV
jgi:16S rRNA G1207 methylase RsmC